MPQRSNREALLEGALRCVGSRPAEQITARTIAQESGANLASIGYHFGSKDALITAAVVEGLDRWLIQIGERLADLPHQQNPLVRFREAAATVNEGQADHDGIAKAFVAALARAHHDTAVAERLAEGFMHTRPRVAELLDLGSDTIGTDAGALIHAMFVGLLIQTLLDDTLTLDGPRIERALARITTTLATPHIEKQKDPS